MASIYSKGSRKILRCIFTWQLLLKTTIFSINLLWIFSVFVSSRWALVGPKDGLELPQDGTGHWCILGFSGVFWGLIFTVRSIFGAFRGSTKADDQIESRLDLYIFIHHMPSNVVSEHYAMCSHKRVREEILFWDMFECLHFAISFCTRYCAQNISRYCRPFENSLLFSTTGFGNCVCGSCVSCVQAGPVSMKAGVFVSSQLWKLINVNADVRLAKACAKCSVFFPFICADTDVCFFFVHQMRHKMWNATYSSVAIE